MIKIKRSYTKEFKVKACELVTKDGIKPAVMAEKLGIHLVMLYRWIDEYRTYGDEAFVGKISANNRRRFNQCLQ